MSSKFSARTGLVVLAVAATTGALAHTGATGVVKARMDAMMEIGQHMKTISEMLRGNAELDGDAIRVSATQINGHANALPDLFPEGSIAGPSEAAPEIWTSWGEFTSLAEDLAQASATLAEISDPVDADTLAASFRTIGQTCASCHETFRASN